MHPLAGKPGADRDYVGKVKEPSRRPSSRIISRHWRHCAVALAVAREVTVTVASGEERASSHGVRNDAYDPTRQFIRSILLRHTTLRQILLAV